MAKNGDVIRGGALVLALAASLASAIPAWSADPPPEKPPAHDAAKDDAFLDWASERPGVAELSVEGPGTVWVALLPERYESAAGVRKLARELACGYDRIVGHKGAVVTVWPETGVGGKWVAREKCK